MAKKIELILFVVLTLTVQHFFVAPNWAEEQYTWVSEKKGERGADCGIYALGAVAHSLGTEFDIRSELTSKNVPSSFGSTAKNLMDCAKTAGLHCYAVENANVNSLLNSSCPAIINVGLPDSPMKHWIAFLGTNEDGMLSIYDSARSSPVHLSASELLLIWNGEAIFIDRNSFSHMEFWLWWESCSFLLLIVAFSLIAGIFAKSYTTVLAKLFFLTICLTSIVAMGVAINAEHIWHNQNVANWLLAKHDKRSEANTIYTPEVERRYADGDTIFIDARRIDDFNLARLKGSINIPIDTDLADFRRLTEPIKQSQKMVVFCAGPECSWADVTAIRLIALGFADVKVYRSGFNGIVTSALGNNHVERL